MLEEKEERKVFVSTRRVVEFCEQFFFSQLQLPLVVFSGFSLAKRILLKVIV